MSDKTVLSYPNGDVPSVNRPRPARFKPVWPLVTGIVGTVVVAAGSFLTLASSQYTGVRGSTRSAKLRWETREGEIADAIAREKALGEAMPDAASGETLRGRSG